MRGSLVRARRASATCAGLQWACMSIIAVMAVFLHRPFGSLTLRRLAAKHDRGRQLRPHSAASLAGPRRADLIALSGNRVPSKRLARSVALVGEQAPATGARATMTRDLAVGCRGGLLGQPLPPQLLHAGTDCL